jgi:RHS repeat-associated protein
MFLRKYVAFLTSLFITLSAHGAVPNEHYRDALWVAESHGILKLLAANGTLEVEIDSAEEVRAVAVDAIAGRVWVAKPKQLLAYGFDGEPVLDLALEPLRPSAERHLLSVDRRDGTVWLARGGELRLFDFNGAELGTHRPAKDVQAMSLARQAGQRWIATKEEAVLWDEEGNPVATFSVPRGEKLHDVAYDPSHEALWLLTSKQLYFYDVDAEQVDWSAGLRKGQRIRLLGGEGAWVAGDQIMVQISPAGEHIGSFEYSQPGKLVEFVVDSIDGTLWLATQQHLAHYRPDGTEIDRRAFTGGSDTGRLWSLDMYIDDIPPSMHFARPEPGTLTNDNQLPFVLEYSDIGIGTNPATIAFSVNEVAAGMDCAEQGEGSSQCIPNQRLPEGENQVAATVEDFNSNGSEPARVDVTVDTIPPTITVMSPADDSEVTESPVTVTGHLDEAATLKINGEEVPLDGDLGFSADVQLMDGANTVHLSAADTAGNIAQAQLSVILQLQDLPPNPAKVASPIDPSKPTNIHDAARFLFEGEDSIQTNVQPGVIEAKRIAVLRGQVLDRDGNPLPGVTIRVHDDPKYGTTMTRTNGMFDFAVNGGGVVTLEYEKAGHMTVQRSIDTPWRDYKWLPDVVMTQYDNQVTEIDLSGGEAVQTARGSNVIDADGERTATVMFPDGVAAKMVMPDGSRQELSGLSVRATEYTVGDNGLDAMPGELQTTSAYTYAVELSVDEAIEADAVSVEFSSPLPFYVENFLDFPVGTEVPLGYYDREEARWITASDGRIVKIIDIADGQAVLDVSGSGSPATGEELEALSISDAEVTELAELYEVGQSLWRAPVDHFTPWDCNWPYTFPDDAEPPSEDVEQLDRQEDDPTECSGSIVECQNQVLGERIDIIGTSFSLNYRSNRVPGRRAPYKINIPITGESVPESLKRVEIDLSVAGRRFSREFSVEPDQVWHFEWDGLDAYGRQPLGGQAASISIRYIYDGVYLEPGNDFNNSFANAGGFVAIGTDRARSEIFMKQEMQVPIGVWDARVQGLGGWTLSAHHGYEESRQQVFLGTGNTRRAVNVNSVVNHYAGLKSSQWGFSGDGGPATEAQFRWPSDITTDERGQLYIADRYNHRVRKIDPETGIITTIAGNGLECDYYDTDCIVEEGPSLETRITEPQSVTIGPNGDLYIGYRFGIARASDDGMLTIVQRDREFGLRAYLGDIAVDESGAVYYEAHNSIKKVSSDGETEVIDGTPWRAGHYPNYDFEDRSDLLIGNDGSLYISDSGNHVIRRIGLDGRTRVVAGAPELFGYSPDGSIAEDSRLGRPEFLEMNNEGDLFIGEDVSGSIRKILPDGRLSTVAGRGSLEWIYCPSLISAEKPECKDGAYARTFFVDKISGLALDEGGILYMADLSRNVIWKVEQPFPDLSDDEKAVPSRGGDRIFVFGPGGRHRRTLDMATGAVIYQFEYGEQGFLTRVVGRYGNETSIRRDQNGKPLSIIGPFGQETNLTLDAKGYLTEIEDPLGHSHEYTHEDGLLRSARDPNGNASSFGYDEDGRLVADADPIGGGWSLLRNDVENGYEVTTRSAENWSIQHRVTREEDGTRSQVSTAPHGSSSIYLENPDGTATSTTPEQVIIDSRMAPHPILGPAAPFVAEATASLPGGQSMSVERMLAFSGDRETVFGEHDVDETVTVNGRQYRSHYDAASRTWTRTSPEGRTSTVQFNEHGQVVSTRLGSLAPVERMFNSRGQVGKVNQSTRTTSLTYDGNGYLKQIVDAESRATTLKNDGVGRTRELQLPGDRLVAFDFDANGNVTGINPPERPTHGFAYNGVDLATRYEPPEVDETDSTVETDYRLDRTVGTVTRADGGIVDLSYGDTTGLLTDITAPQGSYSYTYLPNSDRLASATGPAGQRLDYAWNGPLVDQVSWSGTIDGDVDYAWDNNFWLDSITVNGQVIDYGYDNDGLVTAAGSLALDYAPDVPLLESTALGSVESNWSYSEYGEPRLYETGIADGPTLYRSEFRRDQLGRITEKVEAANGVETTYAYEYDPAGRLTEVREDGVVVDTYTYDANGNRQDHNGTEGIYDDQDRLLSYGDYDYSYTADGELKTQTDTATGATTDYEYDAFSNLRSITLPDGTEIEYVIDAQNRRIGKKVNGTLVQGFLYGDQLNPVAELDGNGDIESIFVYASRLNVPDYMIKSDRTYRIIADHLGSIRLVVDTKTSEIVQEMDYSPFGIVTRDTNPGFQPFGFAGGIYDRDTGLVRFGARDYDPQSGRWTGKDILIFPSMLWNRYVYVGNDPLDQIDRNGLSGESAWNGFFGYDEDLPSPDALRALDQIEKGREYAQEEANEKAGCASICLAQGTAEIALGELVSTGLVAGLDRASEKNIGWAKFCGSVARRVLPGVNLISSGITLGETAGCITLCPN